MNIGDMIIWRFKDKKLWKRGKIGDIINEKIIVIVDNNLILAEVIVKLDEIDLEILPQ